MRRWETFTALAAVVAASLGSLPHVPGRLTLTIIAVVLIVIVGVSRLLEALKAKPKAPPSFDPAERARSIRERRGKTRER